MRKLPDIPRCEIKLPSRLWKIRYFPRRSIEEMISPGSSNAKSWDIGHLSFGCRIIIFNTLIPTKCGSMPLHVVSTSGNSGKCVPSRCIK